MNSKFFTTTLCLAVFSAPLFMQTPAQAEDTVMTTYRASLKVADSKRFRERINNSKTQIETGVSKNWLTQEQAEHFNQEYSRVDQMEQSASAKGFPKEDSDQLELAVTALNHSLTSAMAKTVAANAHVVDEQEKEAVATKKKPVKSVRKHKKHKRQA